MLGAEGLGMQLTERGAMLPAASVSGAYFSHPNARYFNVGRVDRDQVESYAKRAGITRQQVEIRIQSNLAY